MDTERRHSLRLEAFCLVKLQSAEHGISYCVARNVSEGGIFLEVRQPLPLGATLRLWFLTPDGRARISAIGEVKNHYYLHYNARRKPRALTGMGVRFLTFEDPAEAMPTFLAPRQEMLRH